MKDTAFLYLGALAPDRAEFQNAATSRAAQIFQCDFLAALADADIGPLEVAAYYPVPSFLRSRRLLVFAKRDVLTDGLRVRSLGHINLGALKVLTLGVAAALRVLSWSLRNRSRRRVVVTYNLNAPPAFMVGPVCRLLGAKFVPFVGDIYVPGEVVAGTLAKRVEFALQRRAVSKADGLLVCNRAIVDDFAPRAPHALVEGGVPCSIFTRLRRVPGTGPFHIVFAGQLSELNGVRLLLDAMRRIEDLDVAVTVLGGGALAGAVREAASRDPRICFRGLVSHDEVLETYCQADLLLNLRKTDCETHRYVFPSKVVECLATGVPLLSTRTGHVESEFGEFVFLLEQETPAALAEEVSRIKAMRAEDRLVVGTSAQEHVRREKTWDAQVRKALQHIERDAFHRQERKTRVLAFVDYYLPGFKGGGPAVSVSRLALDMAGEVDFMVYTRDRDLGDTGPYACAMRGTWVARPEAHVWYAKKVGAASVLRAIREARPDVVYLNSLFSRMTRTVLLLRLLGLLRDRGVVLAPRGELSVGALALKSPKKRAYLALAKLCGLYRGLLWKPSTALERQDIEAVFGEVECYVLPEMPAPPLSLARAMKAPGACKFVFVSRVSRKKNVEFALEAMRGLSGQVSFDIYGPLEDDAYRADLERAIAALPPNVVASLRGPITPQDVPQAIASAHFFLFPTLGENFGHAIAESLAVGTPCILSDQTPWSDLQQAGAGWALPLEDPATWQQVLQSCIDMDDPAYEAMVARVRGYYSSKRSRLAASPSEGLFNLAKDAA
jgi:glycosyltransferase involved in cell wall biosynthesis